MRTSARAAASFLGLSAVILLAVFGTVACQSGEQPDTQVKAEHARTETESEQVTMYTCSMCPEVTSEEPGECPMCGMDLVEVGSEKAGMDASKTDMVMWTCPMHPEVQRHKAGECPECGMDLIEAGSVEAGS